MNCDYPQYELNKLVSKKFVHVQFARRGPGEELPWNNDDQNVSTIHRQDGMTPDDAAKKWVDANPDKVKAWLG